jgi:hypothetical protein
MGFPQALSDAVLLSKYGLKARFVPAVLAASPLVVALAIPLKLFGLTLATGTLGACLASAMIYAASQAVRAAGLSAEPKLWASWDGPPSTRFVRWRDGKFAPETKRLIHGCSKRRFGIMLFTQEEESADPNGADDKIAQAFMQVRQALRTEAGDDSLVATHNAEYGFLRNLLGVRTWAFTLAVICFCAAGASYLVTPTQTSLLVLLVEMLIICATVLGGWLALPGLLKHAADRYAESAWSCFLQLPSSLDHLRAG